MSADGIALFYLARGADPDYLASIRRFVEAYRSHPAGVAHELVVIFKGFASERALDGARAAMSERVLSGSAHGRRDVRPRRLCRRDLARELRARRVSEHRQ